MPSHPFHQHPTLAEYIHWAEQEGCSARSGLVGFDTVTKITNTKNGKVVVQGDMKQEERLSPSTVDKLDRRLGLESPWNPNFPDQS